MIMHIILKPIAVVLVVLSLTLGQTLKICFMWIELGEDLQVCDQIWHMKENYIVRRNKEHFETGQQLSTWK